MLISMWQEYVTEIINCNQSFEDFVTSDPDMVYGCLEDLEYARRNETEESI